MLVPSVSCWGKPQCPPHTHLCAGSFSLSASAFKAHPEFLEGPGESSGVRFSGLDRTPTLVGAARVAQGSSKLRDQPGLPPGAPVASTLSAFVSWCCQNNVRQTR